MGTPKNSAEETRFRILEATAELINQGGRDAATTRAIAMASQVQAPLIYRYFGDKQGLLDAVVEHVLAAYVEEKSSREPHQDPVEELREGWNLHVRFGLAHPGLFLLMNGDHGSRSPAAASGYQILSRKIKDIALAGRLKMSESRATALVHAVCLGTVLSLIGQPEALRDPKLAETAREMVIQAISNDDLETKDQGVGVLAVSLNAKLAEASVLSNSERQLLGEWLERIADE